MIVKVKLLRTIQTLQETFKPNSIVELDETEIPFLLANNAIEIVAKLSENKKEADIVNPEVEEVEEEEAIKKAKEIEQSIIDELTDILILTPEICKELVDVGITGIDDLAETDIDTLASLEFIKTKKFAKEIVTEAKKISEGIENGLV